MGRTCTFRSHLSTPKESTSRLRASPRLLSSDVFVSGASVFDSSSSSFFWGTISCPSASSRVPRRASYARRKKKKSRRWSQRRSQMISRKYDSNRLRKGGTIFASFFFSSHAIERKLRKDQDCLARRMNNRKSQFVLETRLCLKSGLVLQQRCVLDLS